MTLLFFLISIQGIIVIMALNQTRYSYLRDFLEYADDEFKREREILEIHYTVRQVELGSK